MEKNVEKTSFINSDVCRENVHVSYWFVSSTTAGDVGEHVCSFFFEQRSSAS